MSRYIMKRMGWVIILLLLAVVGLYADNKLSFVYKNDGNAGDVSIEIINGREYVDIDKLAAVFKASVKSDRADKRLYVNIYDEQFIFLARTDSYSFKNSNYRLAYPLIVRQGKSYVPASFARETLPRLYPDEIKYLNGKFSISQPRDYTIRTIVLDPGHGGKDPGAVGKNNKGLEKDINLAVALKLKPLLENELGVRVLLTRTDDRFVSLQERTKFANDKKADLFVCIHTNASRDRSCTGIEVYYLSTAKTTEARAVEALENSVVETYEGGKAAVSKYDDLALILSDIMQAENLEQSCNLAMTLQTNMCAGTKAPHRGVHQANFYVLRGAFMPSVLIEMGFVSNAQEASYLLNDQYRDRLARTIFEGIKSFKYRYDRIRTS